MKLLRHFAAPERADSRRRRRKAPGFFAAALALVAAASWADDQPNSPPRPVSLDEPAVFPALQAPASSAVAALPQGVLPTRHPNVFVEFKPADATPSAMPTDAADAVFVPGMVIFLDEHGQPTSVRPPDWQERLSQGRGALTLGIDLPAGVQPGEVVPAPGGGVMAYADMRSARFSAVKLDEQGHPTVFSCVRAPLSPVSEEKQAEDVALAELDAALTASLSAFLAGAPSDAEPACSEREAGFSEPAALSPMARLMVARQAARSAAAEEAAP
jgi:hypothetical protein